MTAQDEKKVIDQKVVREMTIEEILNRFAHKAQLIAQELTSAGLHCVGCQAATWETLEGGMRGHGMSDEQIDAMVDKLNAIIAEEVDLSTIELTARAAKKLLTILEEEKKQGWGIRFSLKKGGCSGFEHVLDYSEKALPNDEVFVSHGLEVHVDKEMLPKVLGSQIDYVDGLQGAGFKISNPNAKRSCGCGSSHGY